MLYSPRINAEQIHDLYLLKKKTGRKMTTLVREALADFIGKYLTEADRQVVQERSGA